MAKAHAAKAPKQVTCKQLCMTGFGVVEAEMSSMKPHFKDAHSSARLYILDALVLLLISGSNVT